MNARLLIDAVVRQTTVLIAQLATSAGVRAPLAHIANETFLSLVSELERQGVGQKVIADMFGLALRSYQQKVQRLSESVTDRGVTLWQAVYGFMQERKSATRQDVLRRFARDDERMVVSILGDLAEAGLLYQSGRGADSVYRLRAADDPADAEATRRETFEAIVWAEVHRTGPVGAEALAAKLSADATRLRTALDSLEHTGRIASEGDGDGRRYLAESILLPLGEGVGWEASLFDHYQAVVAAMCSKLRRDSARAEAADEVGGSTFALDVWQGHPYRAQARRLLAEHRHRLAQLWDDIADYNAAHEPPHTGKERVTFYFGQSVRADDNHATKGDTP